MFPKLEIPIGAPRKESKSERIASISVKTRLSKGIDRPSHRIVPRQRQRTGRQSQNAKSPDHLRQCYAQHRKRLTPLLEWNGAALASRPLFMAHLEHARVTRPQTASGQCGTNCCLWRETVYQPVTMALHAARVGRHNDVERRFGDRSTRSNRRGIEPTYRAGMPSSIRALWCVPAGSVAVFNCFLSSSSSGTRQLGIGAVRSMARPS